MKKTIRITTSESPNGREVTLEEGKAYVFGYYDGSMKAVRLEKFEYDKKTNSEGVVYRAFTKSRGTWTKARRETIKTFADLVTRGGKGRTF